MSLPRSLALCLLTLLPVQVAIARHDGNRGDDHGGGHRAQQRQISPREAGERVRRETGGRVLGVTPSGDGYRVKVLTPNGAVRQIHVPGR